MPELGGDFCLCFCCCFHFVKWMDLKGESRRRGQYQQQCKPNINHSHRLRDLVIMGVWLVRGNPLCKRECCVHSVDARHFVRLVKWVLGGVSWNAGREQTGHRSVEPLNLRERDGKEALCHRTSSICVGFDCKKMWDLKWIQDKLNEKECCSLSYTAKVMYQ